MMNFIHYIGLLLDSTREWLANQDTWKVLTKIHLSKSIQVTGNTYRQTSWYIETPHTTYGASENNCGNVTKNDNQILRLSFLVMPSL